MVSTKLLNTVIVLKRSLFKKTHYVYPIFNASRNYETLIPSFKFSDLQVEIASNAQKMTKPDPHTLRFGETFSDHMFEVEWNHAIGWGKPRIVPLRNFQFHPGCKIFHYAQALFEGMKAFRHSDGSVALFRPDMNVKRLLTTAERAAFPLFDGDEFLMCLKKLVSIDSDWIPNIASSSLYIRPTFIGIQNSLGVHPSNSALLYIITCPVGSYFPKGEAKPVSLADPSNVRAWPGGVGNKKMASNYAPTLYIQKLAEDQGFQQVLWLYGKEHQVCEVGAMNVFFFFQKGPDQFELATPELDGTILPGVVRQSVLDLARQINEFEVSERTITMGEIVAASEDNRLLEVFGTGTACSVCPVEFIKFLDRDIKIPTMLRENSVHKRLYKMLTDIQYGKVASDWAVKVA